MPEVVQTRDLITRTCTVRADTVDEQTRSVEAVLATQSRVTVFDWSRFEAIDEILLARGADLPEQMVLLEDHNQFAIRFVHGSIRDMRIDGNQVLGRLHFAANAGKETERAWEMVKQGHLRDVSIGYRAIAFTDIQPGESADVAGRRYTAGQRVLRISTEWRPKEGSVVVIGADEEAKIRSQMMGLTMPQPKQATRGEQLADSLTELMGDLDRPRAELIDEMAEAAEMDLEDVEGVLAGDRDVSLSELEGIAAVLGTETDELIDAAIADGGDPNDFGVDDDDGAGDDADDADDAEDA